MIVNFRPALGDVLISRFQALGDRIGRGNKIFLVNFVGAFQKLLVVVLEIFCENFLTRFFLGLKKVDALHMRAHHPHHGVAIFLNGLFARHHRHRRIRHFDARVPEHPVTFLLGLHVKWIGEIRRIDEFRLQSLDPVGRRSNRQPRHIALRIDTVPFHHHAMKKIAQRTQARAG